MVMITETELAEAPRESKDDLLALEIQLLLDAINRRYGYDFHGYAYSSLKRRIGHFVRSFGLKTVSGLQELVLHDPSCMEELLLTISVHVTSMFRDPEFFLFLRKRI